MVKLILGVGINDGKCLTRVGGKIAKEYNHWRGLLERCYEPKYQRRKPTYVGCQASENFKSYSYFHGWCQRQIGFGREGYHLDKDLIFKGNKLYSEDTCLFLPRELNTLFMSCKAARGDLPVGVTLAGNSFKAECHTPTPQYLGVFHTSDEAFNAYKQAKEAFIKRQAEKWKAHIDPRAYEALIAYTISITD